MNDKAARSKEILVIDDDPIMRDLITDWLEAAGYKVYKATDCSSACTALDRAPALVVSDMWMPGPCGAEAIRWMRQKNPGLQLIAVSGHFGSGQGCTEEAGAHQPGGRPGVELATAPIGESAR